MVSPSVRSRRPWPFGGLAGAALAAAVSLALPSAHANPTGPTVLQGTASVASAGPVVTVTASPGTVIEWQRFVVAPGEVTRFVLPSGSPIINRVPGGFSVLGSLESSAPVYFLSSGLLSGGGRTVDLGALVNSSLRFDALPSSSREGGDETIRSGQALANGKAFLIGSGERQGVSRSATGSLLLAPGERAELGDLRVPFVRVHVIAPATSALDIDSLVARRPQIGIFNALFMAPPTRRSDSQGSALASVEERRVPNVPIPPAPMEERTIILPLAVAAPVEERVAKLLVNNAPVEERVAKLLVNDAPVEERVAKLLVNDAPVEERVMKLLVNDAPVEEVAMLPKRIPDASKIVPVVALSTPQQQSAPMAVRTAYVVPASDRPVAQPAVIIIAAKAGASSEPASPAVEKPADKPVKLTAIQKRMPRIMFDRKGAIFHM